MTTIALILALILCIALGCLVTIAAVAHRYDEEITDTIAWLTDRSSNTSPLAASMLRHPAGKGLPTEKEQAR